MNHSELQELSDQELLQKKKKADSGKILTAALIGVFIGVAVFSTVRKGLGFFTFFPLIFAFILSRNTAGLKEIEQEIKRRNLQ